MAFVWFLGLYVGISMIVLFALLVLGVLVLFIANLMHKKRVADISTCFLFWTIFPFVLPFKAKKKQLISKQIYGWILVLLSPLFVLTYLFFGICAYMDRSISFEELPFTSREEIAAITEIEDFPEFEYLKNNRDGWSGVIFIQNKFKGDDITLLLKKVESKLTDKENVFWSTVVLSKEEDKDFFGCNEIYACKRGWNTQYMEGPDGVEKSSQVEIYIGKKAFNIRIEDCRVWDLEYYSNSDSLSVLTGVNFPNYEIVNLSYFGDTIDPLWTAILKLDKKPGKSFIQSLTNSKGWNKNDDGTYHFYCADRNGKDLWEEITIDPKSRLVELHVSTH